MKNPLLYLSVFFLAACTDHKLPTGSATGKPNTSKLEVFRMKTAAQVGRSIAGQDIMLGGFSSLALKKIEDNKIFFWSITDRGPNAEEIALVVGVGKNTRPFVLPEFRPMLTELSLNLTTKEFKVESYQAFQDVDVQYITGLPPQNKMRGSKPDGGPRYELPITLKGKKIEYQSAGMDTEGYCRANGFSYAVEEYGPNFMKFDSNLKLVKKWEPGKGLPKELGLRPQNRGLEGLACSEKYAYLLMQSPLSSALKKDFGTVRLEKFDLAKEKIAKEYFYPVDISTADKLGDLALIQDEKFLVVEQNGKLGQVDGVRKIYQIDLKTADKNGLVKKNLIVDLNAIGLDFVEKIEGITIVDAKTLAVVVDNDFGLQGALDMGSGKVSLKADQNSYIALVHLDERLF